MDGQPLIGEQVAVFGQGIVGLLTTALLAEMPLTSLVTLDRYPQRRQWSKRLGAAAALDPADGLEAVRQALQGERPYAGAPRTLDLDLLLLADRIVDEPGLQVPHPRFRARFFVLGPLTQIAPDMRDPVTGLTASELLRSLMRDDTR